ncbi:MAG TPA: 2-dehydro-3-deoxygalactonokinase [Rhizomicrobium sp.]|nr:2-dehydro-3-deoxygalactonokinase [Rhizomicrobium sp.]
MNDTALIGVDWGSSSVRAFRLAQGGTILDVRRADDGVFTGSGPFEARLRRHLGDWLQLAPAAPLLLCGMIGSDRGWRHAPYSAAPAGLDALARALLPVPFERPARIVPGVSFVAGETCEVMRGEETLLMGIAARPQPPRRLTVCLPGTHSKWAELDDGRIVAFRTHMTGELRALVLSRGALASDALQNASPEAFRQGLAAAAGGDPVRALFQARARRLLGRLGAEHIAAFVSGVLIGAEIAREAPACAAPLVLAARGALAEEYGDALARAGVAFTVADPETLAADGLTALARAAGLAP